MTSTAPKQRRPRRTRGDHVAQPGVADRQRGVQIDVQRTQQQRPAGPGDRLRQELRIEERRPEVLRVSGRSAQVPGLSMNAVMPVISTRLIHAATA